MHDLEEPDTYKVVLKGISLPVSELICCPGLDAFRAAVLHLILLGCFLSEQTLQHVSLCKNDTYIAPFS